MLKKANINWSCKQLAKMATSGSITFENAVQRSYCWDNKRKSLLIHSFIEGYPVPPFYAVKTETGAYDMLDGRQRGETIKTFLNNEFALTELDEVETEETIQEEGKTQSIIKNIDITGKTFSELPEDIQDRIKDYSLTIYFFQDISDEEISEMFFRLNNGKPLSSIELTRVKAKSFEIIKELGKHSIFSEAISEKALNKYTNEDIIIKSWSVLNMENPSFETKKIRPIMETAEFTDQQTEQINQIFDRLREVHDFILDIETENKSEIKTAQKIAKKIYTRTHLLALVPFVFKSIEDNLSTVYFASWVKMFFGNNKGATVNEKYNNSCQFGSAKSENVAIRFETMNISYKSCFFPELTEKEIEMDLLEEDKNREGEIFQQAI